MATASAASRSWPNWPALVALAKNWVRSGHLFGGGIGSRFLSGHAGSRFVDLAEIVARGGRGGQGAVSFERLRDGRRGRANGGNGGAGGDVILRSSSSLRGLSIIQSHINAQDGMNGGSNLSHGHRGHDTVMLVPCGTLVDVLDLTADRCANDTAWLDIFGQDGVDLGFAQGQRNHEDVTVIDEGTGDGDDKGNRQSELRPARTRVDLIRDGDQIVVAKGGRGGMGNRASNMRYRKGVQYVPVAGIAGDRVRVRVELKLLADIGLVGYPNAGKSTLLSVLSRARPRIDSYPFTTLQPHLGVVEFDDLAQTRGIIADIPGLIPGAAENRGLGHEFLRHIERTQVLLYVVDVAGTEGRDPIQDYRQLRLELGRYDADLVKRPALVFANKTDRRPVTCARHLERLRAEAGRDGLVVVAGSAMARRRIDDLRGALYDLVHRQTSNLPSSSSSSFWV